MQRALTGRMWLLSGFVLTLLVVMSGCADRKPRPNIVLVVLDTVRDDLEHLSPDARPNLQALAAASTVFTNAWATAPWTVPSHASMFTGMLSAGHHCTHQNPRLETDKTTLAELLTADGYATAAFYSNPWLSDRTTGLLRGFTLRQEAPVAGGIENDPGTWRGDQGGRASVSYFRRWVKKQTAAQPFFAFVNLLEAHMPYDPSPQIRRSHLPERTADEFIPAGWGLEYQAGLHAFADVDWDQVRDLYWGDVMTVDHLLSGITATLDELGLTDDTILIVCSDHGENLGEHGIVEHQFSLNETLLAVPLLIRAPDYLAAGERDDPVMLCDVFATVRELAQVKSGQVPAHSRSLLGDPAPASRPLVAEYALPQASLLQSLEILNPAADLKKYKRSLRSIRVADVRLTLASDGEVQLHDLARDPEQAQNLMATRSADVKALRELMNHELSAYRPGGRSEVELDEATREQLRSLGYVR